MKLKKVDKIPKRPNKEKRDADPVKYTEEYMKMYEAEATSNTKGQKGIGGMDDKGVAKYVAFKGFFAKQAEDRKATIDAHEAELLGKLKESKGIAKDTHEEECKHRKNKKRRLSDPAEGEAEVDENAAPGPVLNDWSNDEEDMLMEEI
jgi:hypothetical protein